MGLEYRYGITSTLQAGVHRSTLGKTLNVFGRWDTLRQSDRVCRSSISPMPVDRGTEQPAAGSAARRVGDRLARAEQLDRRSTRRRPTSTTPTPKRCGCCTKGTSTTRRSTEDDDDALDRGRHVLHRPRRAGRGSCETVYARRRGLAARWRATNRTTAAWGAAIEKQTHGHVLQLNFGNSFGTTPGMIARGGAERRGLSGLQLEPEVLKTRWAN